MNYFTDTNIPLGYAVIHDKWHKKSTEFILDDENTIFWSTLVRKEYSNKLSDIIFDVESFLKRTNLILKNNERSFVNFYEFEKFILSRTKHLCLDEFKKRKILENFWNDNDFLYENPENIHTNFKKYYDGFQKIYFQRDKKLNSLLILHDCGLNNYLRYLDYAKTVHKWGVHSPDCKIIVDAHDCGKTHDDLIFVSTDNEMIGKILEHNTGFLNIIEFKSCN